MAKKRAPRRHLWTNQRGGAPNADYPTAINRALLCLFPWSPGNYPGLDRGAVRLLENRVAPDTVRDWRRGHRKAPEWARVTTLAAIDKRIDELAKARAALENEKGRS